MKQILFVGWVNQGRAPVDGETTKNQFILAELKKYCKVTVLDFYEKNRHQGFVRIGPTSHVGKNCSVMPMVLLGKKYPNGDCNINIGDNCYIGSGVTILGPVTIGNNVTIGAGAVVTKDVPDNAVVAGVPVSSHSGLAMVF